MSEVILLASRWLSQDSHLRLQAPNPTLPWLHGQALPSNSSADRRVQHLVSAFLWWDVSGPSNSQGCKQKPEDQHSPGTRPQPGASKCGALLEPRSALQESML